MVAQLFLPRHDDDCRVRRNRSGKQSGQQMVGGSEVKVKTNGWPVSSLLR